MTDRYAIARRFDPTYSLLGRWLRGRSDRLRGEALYYLFAITGLVALTFAVLVSWALLGVDAPADTAGTLLFTGVLALAALAFAVVCVVGFKPKAIITISRDAIQLAQGRHAVRMLLTDITEIATVTALTFHRRFRHFAHVHEFSGRPAGSYLLIKTEDCIVGIGLQESERQDLARALRRRLDAAETPVAGAVH